MNRGSAAKLNSGAVAYLPMRHVRGAGKGPTVISVTSGKGGVGKTVGTVHLAASYADRGYKVLVFDGDVGLANVDVVLGLNVTHTLHDVLNGHADLNDIILNTECGFRVIPSGSGIRDMVNLTTMQRMNLLSHVETLQETVDIIIIDTGAGISDTVLDFNARSAMSLVVTTNEPHAITDAYALIKVMSEIRPDISVGLVVNQTHSSEEGLKIFERMSEVCKQFLGIQIRYMGQVPDDPQVKRAVSMRKAVSSHSFHTLAGQAWNKVTDKVISSLPNGTGGDASRFLHALLWDTTRDGNATT